MATFSSKQYSWCNLAIVFGGRLLEGVTEFEYTEKQEKDFLWGRGCKPHAIIGGNKTYDGKIIIWQSELEAMTRDSKNKDVLGLEFNIIVSYVPSDGGQMVTDILKNVQITDVKKGLKQGDKNMLVELPVLFTDVKRQQ